MDDLAVLPDIEDAAGRLFEPYDAGEADDVNITADMSLTSAAVREGRLWVATHGSDVVGFVLATIVDRQAHLHEMAVLPEYGRQGLGSELVGTVERWAHKNGMAAVTLSTRYDIPFNGPFYARLGFTVIQEEQLGPGLRHLRQEEQQRGLDVRRRAIMRLGLSHD
jgi:GNAT superfamily N-acetyltransferase